jgi:fatty acid CoA ligase FadD36
MRVLDGVGDTDGDAPAVTVAGESLSRAQLFSAAAAVADRIAGAQVVAIDADASLRTVVAVLGCLLAGVTAVPVAPDSGTRDRTHIVTNSGAELWLGSVREDVALECVPVEGSSSTSWVEPADGTALILYTSGTTGAPKGVPLTRAAISAGLDGLREAWAWGPQDVLVHGLPLFHVHGLVLGVLGALRAGSPLVHTGRPTPAAYAAARGTLYFGVPTVWGRIAADPAAARELRAARLLVSGSAGLPAPVFRDLAALAGQGPIERYGMTETLITLASRVDGERRPGWVGGPIAGVQARVLDDAGAPVVPDGQSIGRLEVRGATVFTGYLGSARHDRFTSQVGSQDADGFTADGWFRTGDAAAVDEQGSHKIIGRTKDDLIKTGGYRVGAGEIEACLLDYPTVSEAAVIGVPDDDLGQRIVAYVVGSDVDDRELISHVARELSAHKRPREVRVVAALPRNALGKVQKSQLG